jgi:hypothetical protein
MFENKILSFSEASEILNVSQATIRNWIKTGVIAGSLTLENLQKLKISIKNGEIERLSKRANKINSNKNFIPKEYLNNSIIFENIKKITTICNRYFELIEEKILNITISSLIENKEVILNDNKILFKRNIFEKIIDNYCNLSKIDFNFSNEVKDFFKDFVNNENIDILGVLYQTI